ncbi:hypothetical protein FQA39_LY08219 [Lamprigera yunnana]|nr:hypothetical protein FQA39_LY08219 [Lamprigera yunnana]
MNLRADVFTSKTTIDGSSYPPCQLELYQNILRTVYISRFWSHDHLAVPTNLTPTNYGRQEMNRKYNFKWFDGDQVPPGITSVTGVFDIGENIQEVEDDQIETENNAGISKEQEMVKTSDDSC